MTHSARGPVENGVPIQRRRQREEKGEGVYNAGSARLSGREAGGHLMCVVEKSVVERLGGKCLRIARGKSRYEDTRMLIKGAQKYVHAKKR